MPTRIQRKRAKGWRMPPGAVSVTRPGRWGNPFRVGEQHPAYLTFPAWGQSPTHPMSAAEAVECFRRYALGRMAEDPAWLEPLRGKDLACFCAPGAPCHADVLLDLANQPAPPPAPGNEEQR